MKTERLIKMANDIGDFFNAESNKEIAAEGIKKHILRSWDPRMREAIIAYCNPVRIAAGIFHNSLWSCEGRLDLHYPLVFVKSIKERF